MSTILDQILADKQIEVNELKEKFSADFFQSQNSFSLPRVSMRESIETRGLGIIAEIKKRSPSKGELRPDLKVEDLAVSYTKGGAVGLSILTDQKYFGGTSEDLVAGRKVTSLPILRKDFIIDEIQLYQARAIGADVILLIAAALTPTKLKSLGKLARELGLEVLLEVHTLEELQTHLTPDATFIGVNNRDLKTFNVDIELSMQLAKHIPPEFLKITESGLKSSAEIKLLTGVGYKGFLIGESFLVSKDPGEACQGLLSEIQ
jgi:indole-3-glycerol phosphate synthase